MPPPPTHTPSSSFSGQKKARPQSQDRHYLEKALFTPVMKLFCEERLVLVLTKYQRHAIESCERHSNKRTRKNSNEMRKGSISNHRQQQDNHRQQQEIKWTQERTRRDEKTRNKTRQNTTRQYNKRQHKIRQDKMRKQNALNNTTQVKTAQYK